MQAAYEFSSSYSKDLTIALYVGMLVGALFWGMSADMIGRKIAFNVSLVIYSVFTIVARTPPTWEGLGFFIALSAFGAGGNFVLDTPVLLEYIPSSKQCRNLVSSMVWSRVYNIWAWGTGFHACEHCLPLTVQDADRPLANYSCDNPSTPFIPCNKTNNSGW
jgi:MFS family permease